MSRSLIVVGCLLIANVALAEPVRVSGAVMRQSVPGSTIEVDTPLGVLPIHYGDDGRLIGEARGLAFFLGASSDKGRWWIVEDRLCHQWSTWFDGEVHCLSLEQDGSRVFWRRDDGKTGTATITAHGKFPVLASEHRSALGIPLAKEAAARQSQDTNVAAADTKALAPPPPTRFARAAITLPAPNPARRAEPRAAAAEPTVPAGQRSAASRTSSVAPSTPSATADSYRVAGVASDDVLNVRAGPSPEHPVVGSIPPQGRNVKVIGMCQGAWCPIAFGSTRGWVSSLYLAHEDTSLAPARTRLR